MHWDHLGAFLNTGSDLYAVDNKRMLLVPWHSTADKNCFTFSSAPQSLAQYWRSLQINQYWSQTQSLLWQGNSVRDTDMLTGTNPWLTLSLPLGRHMRSGPKYTVRSLYAAIGCWMLTSSANSNFWYILKRHWVLRMNISSLFNISLRLLLDENSISKVNGLAGKGLSSLPGWLMYATDNMGGDYTLSIHDEKQNANVKFFATEIQRGLRFDLHYCFNWHNCKATFSNHSMIHKTNILWPPPP